MHISQKAAVFTESVIREMTRLAMLHQAINLAQGFPDFPAPPELKQAAARAIEADFNQYAITWGAKPLRDEIVRRATAYNGLECEAETHVTVTCGATEAMIATLLAVVDPGEEVIIFEPFYENYGPDCILSQAQPVFVPLHPPQFAIDFDQLRAAFTSRTRAIIINTPNNPTGKVFSRAELERIAALCIEHDVLAITDEIYEYILYDGRQHVSIGSLPGMRDRTVTISGLSKTFSVTGWRLGYAIASPQLTSAIRKVHDFLTVGAPHPLQIAAAELLTHADRYLAGLRTAYQLRRDLLVADLREAGLPVFVPSGAYYVLADIGDLGLGDDLAVTRHLVEKVGVAVVPGSSFYKSSAAGRRLIRFCFPKKDETLRAAGERLKRGLRR
ncbi:MAG: aminotransferase class I/II-fold pyridoxal phosphate-dependent enzyme [Planctomycetota bacterium]